MRIQVRFFASLREALGASAMFEVERVATVGELRDHLIAMGDLQARVLARGQALRCALDQVMCDESAALRDGCEVAFFPPVTGG